MRHDCNSAVSEWVTCGVCGAYYGEHASGRPCVSVLVHRGSCPTLDAPRTRETDAKKPPLPPWQWGLSEAELVSA